MKQILVTGGAGYIGSHAVLALLQAGHKVSVVDNFSNSSMESLRRVEHLAGRKFQFIQGDIRDRKMLRKLFAQQFFSAVLHFAGLKAVGESLREPLAYYDNNINGTVQLCEVMAEAGVHQLVFSSSATVYGDPVEMPVTESCPLGTPLNPYGRSKLVVEQILSDIVRANAKFHVAVLRYFNPVGAHSSGLIGEDSGGIPNNLLPYVSQVAVGRLKAVQVFGGSYATPDGTGVRDYIHVVDLVNGHLCALKALEHKAGLNVWNLGTGRGYSVLEVIRAFERVSGRTIAFEMASPREGDVACCWADATKALRELGWKADRDLDEMIADAWRWQSNNPTGYQPIKAEAAK